MNGLRQFPISVDDLSLYLAHIAHRGKSVCEATAAAISWHHDVNGAESPARNELIRKLIRGAKRLYAKPTVRKSVFTLVLLKSIESRINR